MFACAGQCYLHGVIYDHGERVSPKQCVECNCYDGSFTCTRFDTDTKCPPLPCPPSEQLSVAEECCKFCPGMFSFGKLHTEIYSRFKIHLRYFQKRQNILYLRCKILYLDSKKSVLISSRQYFFLITHRFLHIIKKNMNIFRHLNLADKFWTTHALILHLKKTSLRKRQSFAGKAWSALFAYH